MKSSREDAILAAAEREFLCKGYAGARTVAIAEAAGVTHAMLHYYFRSKDKLFEQILNRKIGLLRDLLLESIGDTTLPLFDKIRLAICSHLDFVAANPDLPRFLVGEVFGQPERMRVMIDALKLHAPLIIGSLQQQIDEYAARRECRRVDARMLLLDIVSLNVFSFMAAPVIDPVLGDLAYDKAVFLSRRKQENIDTIMRKLKP
ncbi:MAG: TetR/AcrR family transcriptional regulator [Muribaculaceae bacterium]|nr:TetR/AcrR family transcriptional regulator [Muribaculaceae bacterium]